MVNKNCEKAILFALFSEHSASFFMGPPCATVYHLLYVTSVCHRTCSSRSRKRTCSHFVRDETLYDADIVFFCDFTASFIQVFRLTYLLTYLLTDLLCRVRLLRRNHAVCNIVALSISHGHRW